MGTGTRDWHAMGRGKAERLSAIGRMANVLGHEIRNPLAAITNAAYLIRMEITKNRLTTPKMFKRLDIIDGQIKSTNKIINDMLVSRASGPRYQASMIPTRSWVVYSRA